MGNLFKNPIVKIPIPEGIKIALTTAGAGSVLAIVFFHDWFMGLTGIMKFAVLYLPVYTALYSIGLID